jgi:hypothetical protein
VSKKIHHNKRRAYTGRATTAQFLGIPHSIIKSSEFAALTGGELKMLLDLAAQYDGKNNGNFDITQLEVRWDAKGNPSREKIAKLKPVKFPGARWPSDSKRRRCEKGLLEKGWIFKTKQGGLGIGPNLYAISWWPVDACEGKHSYPSERTASHLWKKKNAGPETGPLVGARNRPRETVNRRSKGPETGPVGLIKKAA